MKTTKGTLFASGIVCLFFALVLTGCKNNSDSQEDQEIGVDLLEAKTELPSKVRLFFKVDLSDVEENVNFDPSDFEIYENGSQISSLESQAQIKRESGEFLYSSLLLLDLSGSILNNADLPKLKEAATTFIDETMPAEGEDLYGTREMAVYWFDGEQDIHSLVFYTTDRDSLKAGIDSIDENISDDPSTNLNGAVIQGLSLMDTRVDEVREEDSDVALAGSMVLFTDGTDQADRVSTDEAMDTVNTANQEHSIFTIGLGGEIDEEVLSSFGKNGFELAEDSLQLNESFSAVAERLENESNSYYVLEYCSPKRSGEHTLQLRAVHEEMFGSFETDFSAEGFTGGCSVD